MGLINQKVIHKMYGEGIIISYENQSITVRFQQGDKKFIYPDAFDGYLTPVDSLFAEKIKRELELIKISKKEEKEPQIKHIQQERGFSNKNHNKEIKKFYIRANIAFKCNYCDGGRSTEQVGFNGVCSDDIIRYNIEKAKRVWCSLDECLCSQYLKGEITGCKLEDSYNSGYLVCYESQMLRDWKALAGIVHTGERKGQPMKLNQVQVNSLCVLTTRDPYSHERDRYIFAVFLVDEAFEGDNRDEGFVTTRSNFRIKLSPHEAHKMLFWNYYANDSQPEVAAWGTGLHRYLDDEQAIQILQDINKLKQGTKDEKLANSFLEYFALVNNIDINRIPEKNGALQRI
ncbi:MAG TPA: hypothetical protein GX505_06105 [Clostridiales bacterium]|nr:hypothetical protein [Clostridiales bacterium]